MDQAFPVSNLESLDAQSFVPYYVQLADRIAHEIERSGEPAVGKALPSEADCVQHFGVSRPTVRQALDHLTRRGIVVKQRGRGTFVARPLSHDMSHGFEEEMKAARHMVESKLIEWRKVVPTSEVSTALQLVPGAKVWFLKRLRRVDGTAVGVEERYFPEELGSRITRREARSEPMLVLLRRLTSERGAQVQVEVTGGAAGAAVAHLLGTRPDAPVLNKRLTYCFRGQPLAYGSTTFLSKHYQFRFSVNLPI